MQPSPAPIPDAAFAEALGVTITEVPDLDGRCAVWNADTREVRVCRHLCGRRRERVMTSLLGRLADLLME